MALAAVVCTLLACGAAAPAMAAPAGQTVQPVARQVAISAKVRAFDASPAGRALISGEQTARSQAIATRKPVTVTAATTPTSVLVAEPDGHFRQTATLQPVRFQQGGRWVAIDTTLHRTRAGLAAGSVPGHVILSPGGTGPAAVLTTPRGIRTTLAFPGSLGAPVVSGSTASYRTAVPGQVLTLTVTPQGGLTEALTTPARQGSGTPRPPLPRVSVGGPATALGTWTAASAASRDAFRASAPAVVGADPPVAAAGVRAAGTAQPAQVAAMQQVAATMTPMCTPSHGSGVACDNNASGTWTDIQEGLPTANNYGVALSHGEPIGDDVYTCTACRDRFYFDMPLDQVNSSMYVTGAALYETEADGSDWGCTDPWSAQLWWTNRFTSATKWGSNVPGDVQVIGTDLSVDPAFDYSPGSLSSCTKDGVGFSFNVTSIMQNVTRNGIADMTFKITGDEAQTSSPAGVQGGPCAGGDNGSMNGVSNAGYNCGHMRVSDNPEIITDYDQKPPTPTNPVSTPQPFLHPGTADSGCAGNVPFINQTTMQMGANVQANWAAEPVKGLFKLRDLSDGNYLLTGSESGTVSDNDQVNKTITSLTSGDEYQWQVYSETDGATWGDDITYGPLASATPLTCTVVVDATTPNAPAVTGVSNANGTTTLTVASSEPDPPACHSTPCRASGIYQYYWSVNNPQLPTTCTATSSSGCQASLDGNSARSPVPADYGPGSIVSAVAASTNGGTPSRNLCLDDYQGGATAGTAVDIGHCSGGTAQTWAYTAATGHFKANNLCAEASGDATTAGTPIVLATCNTNIPGEAWTQGAHRAWVNENSGLCLTAPSATPGTQLTLAACDSDPRQDWGQATAAITVPVSHWGTNTIYLAAMTTARVLSSVTAYSFYVPAQSTSVLGDVTDDLVPDLLATASDGSLTVYPGTSGSDALSAGAPASAAGYSPNRNGLDWNSFLISHRGTLTGGMADDLYAYDRAHGLMYEYTNADATPSAFPGTLPYQNTNNIHPVVNPATSTNAWPTDITQLLAVGNPDGSSTSPTGLLVIENGTLYFYPGAGGGGLGPRIQLGTSGWGNMTLIAPGYEGPAAQLLLWARDNTSGSLYAYTFTMVSVNGTPTPTLSKSGTATSITPEGGDATLIILPAGVPALTKAAYPAIASTGDGIGPAALYVVDTSGTIRALAGNPHPASDSSNPLQGTLTQVGTTPAGTTISQVS